MCKGELAGGCLVQIIRQHAYGRQVGPHTPPLSEFSTHTLSLSLSPCSLQPERRSTFLSSTSTSAASFSLLSQSLWSAAVPVGPCTLFLQSSRSTSFLHLHVFSTQSQAFLSVLSLSGPGSAYQLPGCSTRLPGNRLELPIFIGFITVIPLGTVGHTGVQASGIHDRAGYPNLGPT